MRPDTRKEFNILQVWLMRKLRSANVVFMFDALDEIPRGIRFDERLRIFSSKDSPQSRMYLTCREAEYRGSPLTGVNNVVSEVRLLEFREQQVDQFSLAWFGLNSTKVKKFKALLQA